VKQVTIKNNIIILIKTINNSHTSCEVVRRDGRVGIGDGNGNR
jgi:hypothetical protein